MRHPSHPSASDLSGFLDGEGPRQRATATHVAACLPCAARLDGLRRSRAVLRSLPRPQPPADLDLRLRVGLAGRRRGSVPNRLSAWLEALRPRRILAPVCALLVVAVVAVTYLESEARARATTTARESLERLLAANRFESMLDGPEPAADRLVGETWFEPGLAEREARPLRRLEATSLEARSLLAAFGDARRAFEMPGVEAVRLRSAAGTVEIRRVPPA